MCRVPNPVGTGVTLDEALDWFAALLVEAEARPDPDESEGSEAA